jgi:hypothetical protein
MIVTHDDLKALRYCNKGTRDFFKRHNLDWSDFVKNGISEEQLINTGDARALQTVEFARERVDGQ